MEKRSRRTHQEHTGAHTHARTHTHTHRNPTVSPHATAVGIAYIAASTNTHTISNTSSQTTFTRDHLWLDNRPCAQDYLNQQPPHSVPLALPLDETPPLFSRRIGVVDEATVGAEAPPLPSGRELVTASATCANRPSTFSRNLAEVSAKKTFSAFAYAVTDSRDTTRSSMRSHLLPTSAMVMSAQLGSSRSSTTHCFARSSESYHASKKNKQTNKYAGTWERMK
jgi:hypothetical protein